jgi:potassium uptake TrkH family protein
MPIIPGSRQALQKIGRTAEALVFLLSAIGFAAVFMDAGNIRQDWRPAYDFSYLFCLACFLPLLLLRLYLEHFLFHKNRERLVSVFEIAVVAAALVLHLNQADFGVGVKQYLQLAVSLVFLIQISKRSLSLEKLKVNPPLLFIFSFLVLILLGTLGLMLPIASRGGLSFTDALFTSTSAVCVTGLTVVDTGTYFTSFGQNILLVLISLGGLGVMTFTSFFGLFFRGETSFRNQMIYKDFTGAEHISDVFSTIVKIVSFTLGIELIGAAILFFSLSPSDFDSLAEQLYFSVFHAISAFNNAGFQLKASGLYDETLRYNYFFSTTIAFLIIAGGLGFAISFNIFRYFKARLQARFRQLVHQESYRYIPGVLNFNSNIVLKTTAILLLAGSIVFFMTEYRGALREHEGIGKWLAAVFLSVTPRTAGFNNIDLAMLSREGILLTMLLMWIGASPGSTGGGIKTSTIAVAALGIFNYARGRDHVEFARREVAEESLMRAFIIITLSLIMLGASTLAVTYFDPGFSLEKIAFEVFSAFSTVGLSLGITPALSTGSKLVVILTMFIGRVGTMTILLGLVKKARSHKFYKYPVESVTIT